MKMAVNNILEMTGLQIYMISRSDVEILLPIIPGIRD